jgi:imidazolonepropionase
MSRASSIQLWRDLVLFDGEQTCPQPMAVWVQDSRIAGFCPEAEFDAAALSDVREVGRGGVMTPGLHLLHVLSTSSCLFTQYLYLF